MVDKLTTRSTPDLHNVPQILKPPNATGSQSVEVSRKNKPKKKMTMRSMFGKKGDKEAAPLESSSIRINVMVVHPQEVMAIPCTSEQTCGDVVSSVLERFTDKIVEKDPKLYQLVALIHDEQDEGVSEKPLKESEIPLLLWLEWKNESAAACKQSFNMLELRLIEEGEDMFLNKLSSSSGIGMESELQDGKKLIVGGTFEKLVQRLVEVGVTDPEYFKAFLLTFRHVEKPHGLMERLVQVSVQKKKDNIHEVLRTINFLLKWMETAWFDFSNDEKMILLTNEFKDNISQTDLGPRYAPYLEEKMKTMRAYVVPPDTTDWNAAVFKSYETFHIDPKYSHLTILDFPAPLFAQLYTAFEHSLFSKIRSHEFTSSVWGYETNYEIPYLELFTQFTNNTSHWVATEVLLGDSKKQIQIVERFLALAKEFLKLRNFNSFSSVVAGISMLNRLKIMQNLSYTGNSQWRQFQAIVSTDRNYSSYRDIFEKARSTGSPGIPSLFVVQNDLHRTSEGMAKYLPNGVIHFRKLSKIYSIIRAVEQFQERPFEEITENDERINWYIRNIPSLPSWTIRQYLIHDEPKQGGSLIDRWNVVDAWDEHINRQT